MQSENAQIERGARIVLTPLSARASERRTADEQLRARFPTLTRLSNAAFVQLPARSRLRRLALARAVLRAYAAANRRDFELVLTGMDPENYEYRPCADLLPPDLDRAFHGHEGYLKLWRYWTEAFEDIRWDPEEVLDFGDRFLVSTQQRGHGLGSGVAVSEPVFQLFNLRAGLVTRQEDFLDRSKALEAAGVARLI
jgi:hypothetical protein